MGIFKAKQTQDTNCENQEHVIRGTGQLVTVYASNLELWFRLALHGKLLNVRENLATHRIDYLSKTESDSSYRNARVFLSLVKYLFVSGALPNNLCNERRQIFSHVYRLLKSYSHMPLRRIRDAICSYSYDPHRIFTAIGRIAKILAHEIDTF